MCAAVKDKFLLAQFANVCRDRDKEGERKAESRRGGRRQKGAGQAGRRTNKDHERVLLVVVAVLAFALA